MSTKLDKFYLDQGLRPMETLVHFGIKGMRWGFRRSDAQLAKTSPVSTDAADAVRARTTMATIQKSKSLASVSDADLNHLVNRLSLEKRYSDINPSAVSKGHEQIKTLLKAGETMNKAISFANSPAGKLLGTSTGLFKSSQGKHAKK